MIDVVMPSYNRAASLRKVVGSYFSQPELGVFILVDDYSTDDTPTLAKELSETFGDRFVYTRMAQKMTTPYLRNVGIGLSKNAYVFMGEDDVLLPVDHFKILLEKMEQYHADIISGRRIYIREGQTLSQAEAVANEDRDPLFVRYPFEGYFERFVDTAQKVPYTHANALIRRAVFDTVMYDPWYGGNAFREELDFFLSATAAGFSTYIIPETLSYHMKNTSTNRSGGSRKKRIVYEWQVWKNTIHCFWKHRATLRTEFQVRHIIPFTLGSLLARYTYALKRRIDWLTHAQSQKT